MDFFRVLFYNVMTIFTEEMMLGIQLEFDWLYIPFFVMLFFTIWAQVRLKIALNRHWKVESKQGMSSNKFAREIIRTNKIKGIHIKSIPGELTDHYYPRESTLNLSKPVYRSKALTAIARAAHETGRLLQFEKDYAFLAVRNSLVPFANIISNVAIPLVLIGFFSGIQSLERIGMILFISVVIFHAITLPIEKDASNRALYVIHKSKHFDDEEKSKLKWILRSIDLAYIAASLTSIFHLIKLIFKSHQE